MAGKIKKLPRVTDCTIDLGGKITGKVYNDCCQPCDTGFTAKKEGKGEAIVKAEIKLKTPWNLADDIDSDFLGLRVVIAYDIGFAVTLTPSAKVSVTYNEICNKECVKVCGSAGLDVTGKIGINKLEGKAYRADSTAPSGWREVLTMGLTCNGELTTGVSLANSTFGFMTCPDARFGIACLNKCEAKGNFKLKIKKGPVTWEPCSIELSHKFWDEKCL